MAKRKTVTKKKPRIVPPQTVTVVIANECGKYVLYRGRHELTTICSDSTNKLFGLNIPLDHEGQYEITIKQVCPLQKSDDYNAPLLGI